MAAAAMGKPAFPIKMAPGNIKGDDSGNKKEKITYPFIPLPINIIAALIPIYAPIMLIKVNNISPSFSSSILLTVAPASPAKVA